MCKINFCFLSAVPLALSIHHVYLTAKPRNVSVLLIRMHNEYSSPSQIFLFLCSRL